MDPVAEAKALAAWRDFKAFYDSNNSACQLSGFVNRHFPALTAQPHGMDLSIKNTLGEELFVRRLPRTGHRGFVAMEGSDHFQVSELTALLDVGGGVKRNFEGLVKHLASFNNRFLGKKNV